MATFVYQVESSGGHNLVPTYRIVLSFARQKLSYAEPTSPYRDVRKCKHREDMKTKAIFYHAGCPVCVAAEQNVASALDPQRFELEVVHLGQEKRRVFEAERPGVKSVPALVLDNQAYHINFGASLDALK